MTHTIDLLTIGDLSGRCR